MSLACGGKHLSQRQAFLASRYTENVATRGYRAEST